MKRSRSTTNVSGKVPLNRQLKEELLRSVGFIPASHSKLPPEVRRLLFFTTSTATQFPGLDPVAKAGYRGKSCTDIHDYKLKWRGSKNVAPFWARNMCRYAMDYTELPLDGVAVNKELAQIFAPPKSNPMHRRDKYKLDERTTHRAAYTPYVSFRPPESYKPIQEKHVSDDAHLMRLISETHETYRPLPLRDIHGESMRPIYIPSATGLRFEGTPHYTEEFTSATRWTPRPRTNMGKERHKDNSARVMAGTIPNEQRNKMLWDDINQRQMERAKSQPVFQLVDWKWLLEHPDVDPLDESFEEAWKSGRIDTATGATKTECEAAEDKRSQAAPAEAPKTADETQPEKEQATEEPAAGEEKKEASPDTAGEEAEAGPSNPFAIALCNGRLCCVPLADYKDLIRSGDIQPVPFEMLPHAAVGPPPSRPSTGASHIHWLPTPPRTASSRYASCHRLPARQARPNRTSVPGRTRPGTAQQHLVNACMRKGIIPPGKEGTEGGNELPRIHNKKSGARVV
ncbi:unnamed protein product [Vitrella brassicaformis CCMP3155]|uniref:Uncharacterized protein n=1 Tax=Vitrella brassicaformis (strain CCMP3155) TaxID=1169540 RepID=A0A0G4EJR6_VITBC|nr:unnamed protein product [Vitrella brassicaformis CCMP3155]|eukprot:CEL96754.1 unnamed protein product [Vitrella brassicaformis CCMP3155]